MNDGLLGFPGGALREYRPKWSGATTDPAVGNGTLVGLWRPHDGLIYMSIYLLMGATTTYGSGNWSFSLPVPARNGLRQSLHLHGLDTGTQHYVGAASINGGRTFEELVLGSNATGPTGLASTAPHTWAATDWLIINGLYVPA